MSDGHGGGASWQIGSEQRFAMVRSLAGLDSGREDPDDPLPPGPWGPVIQEAFERTDRSGAALDLSHALGPQPEPWRSASESFRLGSAILRLIAARHPAIRDVIGGGRRDPGELAGLNPQPLPPRLAFAMAVADTVVRRARAVQDVADATANDGEERGSIIVSGYVGRFVDDYCGTGFKVGWPFPGPPPPWLAEEVGAIDLSGAATQMDSAARRTFGPALRRAFQDASVRLAEAALSRS